MYKIQKDGIGVIRLADMAYIPDCKDNTDWREYQAWLAEGNRPQPAYTPEELEAKQKAEEEAAREALIQTKGNVARTLRCAPGRPNSICVSGTTWRPFAGSGITIM
jgi:hypothetical protein